MEKKGIEIGMTRRRKFELTKDANVQTCATVVEELDEGASDLLSSLALFIHSLAACEPADARIGANGVAVFVFIGAAISGLFDLTALADGGDFGSGDFGFSCLGEACLAFSGETSSCFYVIKFSKD